MLSYPTTPGMPETDSMSAAFRYLSRLMLMAFVLILLGAMALRGAQSHRFDFHRVVVVGDIHHIDRVTVRAALAGHLQGNFFTMHLTETRRALESIPWVGSATVRRVWPDRIEVHLTERKAIGVWNDGRLLAEDGVLFDGNPAELDSDKAAMAFSGPPSMAPSVGASLADFSGRLAAMKMTLSGVDVSNRLSWTVHAREGSSLNLGRDDPPGTVIARLDAIVQSYPRVLEKIGSMPKRIDARYDNGIAVSKP